MPGDLIEFNRVYYSHYALYLGNGNVMNVNAESKNEHEVLVSVETLENVCGRSLVRISNHDYFARYAFELEAKPDDEILAEANRYSNQRVVYDFMFQNCEYYATYWRYGKGFSTQVFFTTFAI